VFPAVEERRNDQDGYRLEYLITIRNLGADPVTELQATDDLATVFAGAETWELVELSVVSGSGFTALAINPNFDGRTDRELLAANQSLAAGQTARLRLVIWLKPPTGPIVFSNYVNITARSGNVIVTDISNPGLDPDPNNNGDPKEEEESGATITIFSPYRIWVPVVSRGSAG